MAACRCAAAEHPTAGHQSFVVSFGFILPTNAPQNMLCYGTGAFTIAQFAKVGGSSRPRGWR